MISHYVEGMARPDPVKDSLQYANVQAVIGITYYPPVALFIVSDQKPPCVPKMAARQGIIHPHNVNNAIVSACDCLVKVRPIEAIIQVVTGVSSKWEKVRELFQH